jgi:hypothetical protein
MGKEVTAKTSYVIRLYFDLAKSQRRARQKELELHSAMSLVAEEDMSEYVRITNELQDKEDKKLEDFERRLRNRRR